MIDDGSFAASPVELFASTSQQWLVDTGHTLRLARQRFEGGRPHPFNQALWMAEVFSRGGESTPLFSMLAGGTIDRVDTPVTRDSNGHISSLVVGDSTYTFVRDAEGDLQSYEIRPNS